MTNPIPELTRFREISCASSQWDAWDSEGNHYYLSYRAGTGTVSHYGPPTDETIISLIQLTRFIVADEDMDDTDGPWYDEISLADFLRLADIPPSPILAVLDEHNRHNNPTGTQR
jgi:hypothetical protein